jgi:hypothetical protein
LLIEQGSYRAASMEAKRSNIEIFAGLLAAAGIILVTLAVPFGLCVPWGVHEFDLQWKVIFGAAIVVAFALAGFILIGVAYFILRRCGSRQGKLDANG